MVSTTSSVDLGPYGCKDGSKSPIIQHQAADCPTESLYSDASTSGTFEKDATLLKYYKPIDEYEGAKRYDPSFEWDPKEEQRLVRTLDLRIMAWCCLTFFALQLDRGNIVQATSDNLLKDLHMNTNDYNNGQTIFYVAFLFAELPSQIIGKRLGPDTWIPIQMVLWSLIAALQALMRNRTHFYIFRALLGLAEGGFIPDTILYLSFFYTSKELPRRLSFFWTTYQFTSIVSAFLAFSILHLRGKSGLHGWAWLFFLEGSVTGLIGIASYFYLPPSPTQTKGRLRGKNGWFTEREEKILVNRILRDDPSKGDMHNRQPLQPSLLWSALKDHDMWPLYLIGLSWLIPTNPLASYLSLQLKSLGFTTFETNLLTIPAYALFIIQLLFWTWLSEKINERLLLGLVSQFWPLPLLIALEVLPVNAPRWGRYALTVMVVGSPYVHAILVSITSRNAGSVRTRTVATALYNMAVQMSSVYGSQIYREDDKPLYRRGNKVLLGFVAYNILLFVGAKVYYVRKNAARDKIWKAKTREQKEEYLATTTDKGNRRLDFRFAH